MNAEEVYNYRLSVLQLQKRCSVGIEDSLHPERRIDLSHISLCLKERDVEYTARLWDKDIAAVIVRLLIVRIRNTRRRQTECGCCQFEYDRAVDDLAGQHIDECLIGIGDVCLRESRRHIYADSRCIGKRLVVRRGDSAERL